MPFVPEGPPFPPPKCGSHYFLLLSGSHCISHESRRRRRLSLPSLPLRPPSPASLPSGAAPCPARELRVRRRPSNLAPAAAEKNRWPAEQANGEA
jgi:hypothetical protein